MTVIAGRGTDFSAVRRALRAGDSGSAVHICLAGEQCGATLLPTKSGGQGPPPYAHGVGSYFGLYGTGQFDGQNSGHDFLGTVSGLGTLFSLAVQQHTKTTPGHLDIFGPLSEK